MISRRKNSVIGVYTMFIIAIFCAVFYMPKTENHQFSKVAIDHNYTKQPTNPTQVDIFNLNDFQEELTLDDLDKLPFLAAIIFEESIDFISGIDCFSCQPLVVHNFLINTLPKYLLYQSLRIP